MSQDSWNPQQYHKFQNERSQPFFDLMAMIDTAHPFKAVIDLGCGPGELTKILHDKTQAQKTVGLDNSAKMLEKARGHAGPGLSFIQDEIQNIEAHGKFDLIFSNAALQWCEGHVELFTKIRNSLTPEGQIAVQMPMNFDYPTHILASKMSQEENWQGLLNGGTPSVAQGSAYDKSRTMLSPEDYASLLFKLGFKKQKVVLNVYGHVLNSREDVIEWVKGTLLTFFQSRLSERDYQNFLAEYKDRLFRELPDEKPFFYPFKRILMWAQL